MEQNSIMKYVNVKNLVRLLIGLWMLTFFMPFVILETIIGDFSFNGYRLVTGISLYGYDTPGSPEYILLILPAVVSMIMWILLDVAKIEEKIVSIVTIVATALGFLFNLICRASISYSVGDTGYADVNFGEAYWFSFLLEIFIFVISLFILLKKVNAEVVLNGYNWKVFVNSLSSQPVQPGQPAQPAQPAQPVQPAQPGQPAQTQQTTCPNCQAPIQPEQKFCTSCGTKLA